jgi:flagellar protein FliO/FliZ
MMFEALFGTEMPLALRFFIAFLVVLALIGAAAYLVRRFGVDRLGVTTARGRQPRLAVIDAATVDGRRRLVLIRRDNVEHLLMIGGPSDIVVEANIVRAQPAVSAREPAAVRAPAAVAEPHPRSAPITETLSWPAEAPPRPGRSLAQEPGRPLPQEDAITWPTQVEPVPRAEPMARIEPFVKPEAAPKHPPVADSLAGPTAESPRPEKRAEAAPPKPRPVAAEEPARAASPPAPTAPGPAVADQNLAEMAQRLEAALRRPLGPREVRAPEAPAKGPAPPAESPAAQDPPVAAERNGAAETAKAGRSARDKDKDVSDDAKSARKETARGKDTEPAQISVYQNLEQEMASLLGRSAGKS